MDQANSIEQQPDTPTQGTKTTKRKMLALIIFIGLAGGGTCYYRQALPFEKTDNAFVEGRIVQIAPRISGSIVELLATDNQPVHKGDLLCQIQPADYEAQLALAQAARDYSKARLDGALLGLDLTKISTSTTVDATTAALQGQKAQVEVAKNKIAQFEAQLVSAKSNLEQQRELAKGAEAEAKRTHADLERLRTLDDKTVSPQQLDLAEAAATGAQAKFDAAKNAIHGGESAVKEAAAARDASMEMLKQAESQSVGAEAALEEARSAPKKVELSETQLASFRAELAQREAEVKIAELNLAKTKICAPADGRITRRSVERGNYVQPGQLLMALVEDEVWVVANYKESQIEDMKPGQPVSIRVDAYPGTVLPGKVDSFQKGSGARFSLLPPENATGNYVKVVQRIPVKILFDGPIPEGVFLAPGMSVVPKVRLR